MSKKHLSDLHEDRRAAQRRLDEIVANNGSKEDREKAQKRLEKVLADIGHAEGKHHASK
jgi:hypothetical protein